MSINLKGPRAKLAALIVARGVAVSSQPAFARGGGPPVWTMTLNYRRQTVYNKGVTDVTRFGEAVKKWVADPVTYRPAYNKPAW